MITPIKTSICSAINQALGTYNQPLAITPTLTAFTGAFTENSTGIPSADMAANYTSIDSACWQTNDGNHIYYKVLLAR